MINQSKKFNKILPLFASLKRNLREVGLSTDKINDRFKGQYASIQNVRATLEPVFEAEGWSLSVDMSNEKFAGELSIKISARLTFLGKGIFNKGKNAWIELETVYPISLYSNGDCPNPQKIEATRTYGTRCTILSLVGISAELDDDGNKSTNSPLIASSVSNIDFDAKLNIAKSLSEVEAVLSEAKEAFDLGILSSIAFNLLSNKAETKINDKRMEKDVAQRKVKRQARIIEKLNAAMIQASSLVEIQTIWGNFNMVVNDLKEIDRTQIKRNIHTETVRISEQIFAGEIIIAPSVQDKEEQAALADVHNFLSTANHDQDVEVESMIPTLELVENVEPVLTA